VKIGRDGRGREKTSFGLEGIKETMVERAQKWKKGEEEVSLSSQGQSHLYSELNLKTLHVQSHLFNQSESRCELNCQWTYEGMLSQEQYYITVTFSATWDHRQMQTIIILQQCSKFRSALIQAFLLHCSGSGSLKCVNLSTKLKHSFYYTYPHI